MYTWRYLGEKCIDLAKLCDYNLTLLDLGLSNINGHDVLRQLWVGRMETSILIVSGGADTENKMKGLGSGTDDYLTIPLHLDELSARSHGVVRRSKGHSQSTTITDEIEVALDSKLVSFYGHPVYLTGKEHQMLEQLSLRKSTNLEKEMFLNNLYSGMDESGLKLIDVFICKL